MSEGKIDCKYTHQIVCPYCEHEDNNSWETAENMCDGDFETKECGTCGKEFEFTRHVTVQYSSEKIEEVKDE